jgi:membrane protein implicated in regulation of membrane protease activity
MDRPFELPREIATAFFFAAAIGVAAVAVVAGRTQRLAPALPVALGAFGVAAVSFAFAIWRSRRWRSRRMFGSRSLRAARR